MKSTVYWIPGQYPGRIAIIPRPRGGDWLEDEMKSLRESGIDVILSLLTEEEIIEFDLTGEKAAGASAGIQFLSFPINDRSIPISRDDALELIRKIFRLLNDGKNVGIHCRQSIGRSALIAAGLMVLAGSAPEESFRLISETRGREVPETAEQAQWVKQLAKDSIQIAA
ncbi:MAG: tyrosine protein phosphatase [Blastocatellales bacterium]